MYGVGKKPRTVKIQKQSEDNIVKSFKIRNPSKLEKKMKQSKTEKLEILGTFLSKKKKIIRKQ